VTLGQPLAAASLLNRLQAIAPYPLLNSADFETGAGFRLEGATAFPRNMAFGAAGDEKLAYEAGRITAVESRAIGIQVNFAPVVDVNNNPRNPVIKAAVASGEISVAQLDKSVGRILRAKARTGLNRTRAVNLDALANIVGGRAHQAVADEVSLKSITLVRDERNQVPLKLARDAQVLYLSILDTPGGWRIAAPSRSFIPELKRRWPSVTSVELSERSTANELELVRAMAPRYDAVVASVFVRASSGSGRMDLPANMQAVLRAIARQTEHSGKPFVAVLFGNPYTATFLQDVPAILLTYDFYDRAERSAVKALAGEAPITGKLPIGLPDLAARGSGLTRVP
jgi:hypothetical protein